MSFDSEPTNLRRLTNLEDLRDISEIERREEEEHLLFPSSVLKSGSKEVIKTIGFSIKKNNDGKIDDEFNPLNASFILRDDDADQDRQAYDDFLLYDEDNENNNSNNNNNENEDDLEQKQVFKLKFSMLNDADEATVLSWSINQYKEKFLGSVKGMNEFKEFLRNESEESGHRLLKFWLDCEFYRDSMQDYDEIENMATRNRLYRDLIEKYVFHFSRKVHEKVSRAYNTPPADHRLTHAVFDQIQYDILRRMRAYWVPRFVLSKLKEKGKQFGVNPLPPLTPAYSRQSTYMSGQFQGGRRDAAGLQSSSTSRISENNRPKQIFFADKKGKLSILETE